MSGKRATLVYVVNSNKNKLFTRILAQLDHVLERGEWLL